MPRLIISAPGLEICPTLSTADAAYLNWEVDPAYYHSFISGSNKNEAT